MSDLAELSRDEMLRYNRQLVLKSVDFDGQERLKAARVLVIGAGGLGCAASQYLVAAGVGKLTLVDFDTVSLSNLQRQILYRDTDIGRTKVDAAAASLRALNPHCTVTPIHHKLDDEALLREVRAHDLVLDCSDNVETRNQLNAACLQTKTPLISGSAIRFEGQVSVFTYQENAPCYRCLSRLFGDSALSCVEAGVIAPIVGVVGSLQALEAIKVLLQIGTTLTGKILLIDGLHFSVREMKLPRDPACPSCATAS